ncbi:MAG: hypothetical protein IJI20_03075 [Firmicutes bacterium]|nr:hypothetical protein [Bacillota bacterium]
MSGSAILMMCIACVGLWGGGLASLIVMFRSSGKTAKEIVEDIEEAEPETFVE